MRKITVCLLILVLMLTLSTSVFAAEVGYVNDYADILTNQE